MSNLYNLHGVLIEMTSYLHHVTQTKHENKQSMEIKDPCFCQESFIDRSFLVLEIVRGGRTLCSPPPWLHKPKNPMVNRVKWHLFLRDPKEKTCYINRIFYGFGFGWCKQNFIKII